MKIAVVGGSGFLGSRLSKRLTAAGADHIIFDKNTVNKDDVFLDVTKKETLTHLNGSDIIINLAAVHRDDIRPLSLYDDVNIEGAENICDAAEKYSIQKIIFTSSVAIYGFAPLNTDEFGDPNYFNDYGRTKYLAEQVFKKWQLKDKKNRSLVILRPTVIFGEGNRGNVYNLLRQIATKKFVMLGSGLNIKSIAYVENVAAFLEYNLKSKSGIHIYNYVDKPDLNMNTLISFTRKTLFNNSNIGPRLPKFIGIIIGKLFDLLSFILKINFSISSIRIKKFMSDSQFNSSNIHKTNFQAPVEITTALVNTLTYEFLEDNSHEKVFNTE